MNTLIGLMIPLLGTILGSAPALFAKREIKPALQKCMLGFASGVMIAASVWSLLIPAAEMAEAQGKISWIAPAAGFLLGIGFLLLLDTVIPHLHVNAKSPEGRPAGLKKTSMLILAVTMHNLPEGMAVGVVFAGAAQGGAGISLASAFALSVGIALQNIPEGAVISLPLVSGGMSRKKAFMHGALSGVVEPLGAGLTLLFTGLITPLLPYILSFAAGAMMYVVIEELIPASQSGEHSNAATISAAMGFVLMMILDVALG